MPLLLNLKYGWQLKNLAHNGFSTDHATICPHGGMIIVRHNEIRDLTADVWLNEVCTETEKESQLQPLSAGENILPRTANKQEARANIKGKGF